MNHAESDKYFIALIPPSPIADQAQEWKEYFRSAYHSKSALNSPPHITLHMPFLWPKKKAPSLIEKLNTFFVERKPLETELDSFGHFGTRVIYVHVIPSPLLSLLQHDLHQYCKRQLNLYHADYKDFKFHPHLTLAFRDLKKEMFQTAWKEFQLKTYRASFWVNQAHLLKHSGKSWEIDQVFNFSE